jgi:hypothetical protein
LSVCGSEGGTVNLGEHFSGGGAGIGSVCGHSLRSKNNTPSDAVHLRIDVPRVPRVFHDGVERGLVPYRIARELRWVHAREVLVGGSDLRLALRSLLRRALLLLGLALLLALPLRLLSPELRQLLHERLYNRADGFGEVWVGNLRQRNGGSFGFYCPRSRRSDNLRTDTFERQSGLRPIVRLENKVPKGPVGKSALENWKDAVDLTRSDERFESLLVFAEIVRFPVNNRLTPVEPLDLFGFSLFRADGVL